MKLDGTDRDRRGLDGAGEPSLAKEGTAGGGTGGCSMSWDILVSV